MKVVGQSGVKAHEDGEDLTIPLDLTSDCTCICVCSRSFLIRFFHHSLMIFHLALLFTCQNLPSFKSALCPISHFVFELPQQESFHQPPRNEVLHHTNACSCPLCVQLCSCTSSHGRERNRFNHGRERNRCNPGPFRLVSSSHPLLLPLTSSPALVSTHLDLFKPFFHHSSQRISRRMLTPHQRHIPQIQPLLR